MWESPIQNATGVNIDLDDLCSIYLSIAKVLGIHQPIAIRLVDSDEMIQLNTSFRDCPENTDVLTFPSGLDAPLPLGDVAICLDYATRQAALRGVTLENELTALLVHACLHLVGFDDIEDQDRIEMQRKMNEVGEQIGIPIDGSWTSILHQEIEHQ